MKHLCISRLIYLIFQRLFKAAKQPGPQRLDLQRLQHRDLQHRHPQHLDLQRLQPRRYPQHSRSHHPRYPQHSHSHRQRYPGTPRRPAPPPRQGTGPRPSPATGRTTGNQNHTTHSTMCLLIIISAAHKTLCHLSSSATLSPGDSKVSCHNQLNTNRGVQKLLTELCPGLA